MPKLTPQGRNTHRGVAQVARGRRWKCSVKTRRIYDQYQPGGLIDLERHNKKFHPTKETP